MDDLEKYFNKIESKPVVETSCNQQDEVGNKIILVRSSEFATPSWRGWMSHAIRIKFRYTLSSEIVVLQF